MKVFEWDEEGYTGGVVVAEVARWHRDDGDDCVEFWTRAGQLFTLSLTDAQKLIAAIRGEPVGEVITDPEKVWGFLRSVATDKASAVDTPPAPE